MGGVLACVACLRGKCASMVGVAGVGDMRHGWRASVGCVSGVLT